MCVCSLSIKVRDFVGSAISGGLPPDAAAFAVERTGPVVGVGFRDTVRPGLPARVRVSVAVPGTPTYVCRSGPCGSAWAGGCRAIIGCRSFPPQPAAAFRPGRVSVG